MGTAVGSVDWAARVRGDPVLRPAPATGAMGDRVRERVVDKSAEMGTTWHRVGDDLMLRYADCADAVRP